jgi:protein-disulfide isomerase
LKISRIVENPDVDIWAEEFHLHERAYPWAKQNLVPRKTTLWQIHRTLLESAKKEKRISIGQKVRLTEEEANIMDLPLNEPLSVWQVLGRLPRFFL